MKVRMICTDANFYPRSPCGERQYLVHGQRPSWEISIHALLAESDKAELKVIADRYDFYPRSPCGERQDTPSISTPKPDFYPRSPCGERLITSALFNPLLWYFYPRSPCGERHCNFSQKRHPLTISIHALLAESDPFEKFEGVIAIKISIHALLAESDRLRL